MRVEEKLLGCVVKGSEHALVFLLAAGWEVDVMAGAGAAETWTRASR